MAKTLKEPVPTSSIVRLFDVDAAARAVASPASSTDRPMSPDPATATAPRPPIAEGPAITHQAELAAFHIKREVVLTERTDHVLTQLVDLYRRHTRSKVTTSHIVRAILTAVSHCSEYLDREARRIGPLKLPANAKGHHSERERFEARLADAFIAGIRNAPAPEPPID